MLTRIAETIKRCYSKAPQAEEHYSDTWGRLVSTVFYILQLSQGVLISLPGPGFSAHMDLKMRLNKKD